MGKKKERMKEKKKKKKLKPGICKRESFEHATKEGERKMKYEEGKK